MAKLCFEIILLTIIFSQLLSSQKGFSPSILYVNKYLALKVLCTYLIKNGVLNIVYNMLSKRDFKFKQSLNNLLTSYLNG